MSSLTSLGVNKNKAKFAPKANRNKVRKRPQTDAITTATNEESSSKNKEISTSENKQDTNIRPRELSPPPPPPITQKTQIETSNVRRTPVVRAEPGSPSTPTPDSPIPTPITHNVPSFSSSKKETVSKNEVSSSKKETASKKETSSKKVSTKKVPFTKKPSKKSSSTTITAGGVSLSTPSKGTSFAAPSRSGGTSITIGERRPRTENDKENKSEDEQDKEEKKAQKSKKKRLEDLRPEELKTLDDIDFDPSRLDDLDRPMTNFTKDIDGIVSKNFRDMEKNRYAQKEKQEAIKRMTKEEIDLLKQKEFEEEERKKKQLQKEKEEQERRKRDSENSVIEESNNALQVRIVDGQIVLDMDSLTVERPHGTAAYDEGSMEVVEESAMTRKVNSKTYGRHTTTRRWDAIETEEFYEAISQFGTDFEMIANILPGRTRNMVRSKFNKEEKVNPNKVTYYMIKKRKTMDLEKYKKVAGVEFDEVPDDFYDLELI